jgi:hypothetical protein
MINDQELGTLQIPNNPAESSMEAKRRDKWRFMKHHRFPRTADRRHRAPYRTNHRD